jgi:RNA polymerase sigma-70 factor (ECF subfamily)
VVSVVVVEGQRLVDASVVERARKGDREAYEQLARETAQRLYPVAFRVVRDRDLADEALQRALVAIWKELPKLRDDYKFEAWSYRVLLRFCTDELRRRARLKGDVSELDIGAAASDQAAALADRDQLERAFGRLSPDHRAVIVLTYYRGLTGAETAAALGVSSGTVASRLHHALRAMRAVLDADSRTATGEVHP